MGSTSFKVDKVTLLEKEKGNKDKRKGRGMTEQKTDVQVRQKSKKNHSDLSAYSVPSRELNAQWAFQKILVALKKMKIWK